MDAVKKAILERKRLATLTATEPSLKAVRMGESDVEEPSSSSRSSESSDDDDDGASSTNERTNEHQDKEGNSGLSLLPKQDKEVFPQQFSKQTVIKNWIVKILTEWQLELDNRPLSEKSTAKGREELRAFNDCEDKIGALLRLLSKEQLDSGILEHLEGIIDECNRREYRKAFERYIDLTIGNAPWPIGVTMVGIHARSGREKIAESKVKHLMKDETVRSYLTSFKRLLSQCQSMYPPETSSKRMG